MLNEYWQACNYAKLLKPAVTPCLPAFLQQVFFNSSLQSLPHLRDLLLGAFQYVHVCCPVEPRNGYSSICVMCGLLQFWIEDKDHHSCWQYFAAQGTIVLTRARCWLTFNLVSTETLDTFLSSCFPDSCPRSLHVLVARVCSFPGAGLCDSHGWVSGRSHQPISLASWGPSRWQQDPLAYQPLPPVLCHRPTYWEYALPIEQGCM